MSDDTETLRDAFRSFFTRESPPERVRAAELGRPPGFDADLWAQAGALGLPGLALDGATPAELVVIAEEYGRAVAPIPVVESLVAARLLDRVDATAATPDGLVTLAVRPAVDGAAALAPAGAVADALIALDGERLVLTRTGRGDVVTPTLGAGPVATWTISDAAVTLADGPDARAAFACALDDWRLLTGAALVGLARRALELGVDYAKARHQFGVPIGSFQALQHRLADVATLVDAAALLVTDAADADPARPAATSVAFLTAVRAARDAAGTSLHVHGGYGFMVEYDVQLYFRRAAAWPLLLGDPADQVAGLADQLDADGWAPAEPPRSAYRDEVRTVVADACTPVLRERVATSGTVHDWPLHRRLADQGFLAAAWPAEWGGRGDDQAEAVLWEELERAGAPTDGWGTSNLVAQTLSLVGRDDQRHQIIPAVLAGEILICLGYSEPDSGSDAAAATTRAERDGDDWVINGQKMFTTLAHEAAYVFLLTRTNPDVAKHRGLTMFLVPMDTPGIEVTPIWTLSGERTNITFYRDVRVPDAARVGDVDGGWDVMRVALTFERNPTMVGELDRVLRRFVAWAQGQLDLLDRPRVRARLADASIDLAAGRALGARMAGCSARGELPVVEGSMAKLFSSEALVRHCAALLDALGADGLLGPGAPGAPADGELEAMFRHAQVTTIRAGTSEIQRGIIAERGLGLPRAGR